MTIPITRENIDDLLNSGKIEMAMRNGNWWRLRRNGATKHWKGDAARIYVPFKAGRRLEYIYGNLTDTDFSSNPGGSLNPNFFRVAAESNS